MIENSRADHPDQNHSDDREDAAPVALSHTSSIVPKAQSALQPVVLAPAAAQVTIDLDALPIAADEIDTVSAEVSCDYAENVLYPSETKATRAEREAAAQMMCFVAGTEVETEDGPRPIETLRRGMKIRVLGGGLQPLSWVGATHLQPRGMFGLHRAAEAPVRIDTGALGGGVPSSPLVVSGNLGILIEGPRAEMLFGAERVLTAAHCMINGSTIRRLFDGETVVYYHVVLNKHAILFANGVACESYRPPLHRDPGFDAYAMIEALTGVSRAQVAKNFMPSFPLLSDQEARALMTSSTDWVGVPYIAKDR